MDAGKHTLSLLSSLLCASAALQEKFLWEQRSGMEYQRKPSKAPVLPHTPTLIKSKLRAKEINTCIVWIHDVQVCWYHQNLPSWNLYFCTFIISHRDV